VALVSVVTPVYNGEEYLGECIASVLNQSFSDWEYVICDNCSTDHTREIIESFSGDKRIRVYSNPKLLSVLDSFNRAASLVSREAKYLKFLCADDMMFRDCLELMVAVADTNPSVRMVGSYKIEGQRAVVEGPPFPQDLVSGRKVSRWFFSGRKGVLGSETNHLIRLPVELVRGNLFDDSFAMHSDTELFIRLLQNGGDFGFVHQVLTFTREHETSVSSTQSRILGTGVLEYSAIVAKHGPGFLTTNEMRTLMRAYKRAYSHFLFRSLLASRRKEIWRYHKSNWDRLGMTMNSLEIASAVLLGAAMCVAKPVDSLSRLRRRHLRTRRKRL